MTRTTSTKATAGALALIAAAAMATAACGREGGLERPGPMFGLARADEQPQRLPDAPVATDRNTTPSSSSADDKTKTGNTTSPSDDDNNIPTTARDIRDPAQRLTPLSASPLTGINDPLGPPVSTKPPG